MQPQNQNQPTPLPEQLQYPWPPNLTTYETKLWLGVTVQQAMLMVMGGMLPMATLRSGWGFVLGLVIAAIIFLSFKKVGRWGGISFPVYLWLRVIGLFNREVEVMELPLILGSGQSTVEVEDWEGVTLMVLGEEEYP
jgi:hypothetical protein